MLRDTGFTVPWVQRELGKEGKDPSFRVQLSCSIKRFAGGRRLFSQTFSLALHSATEFSFLKPCIVLLNTESLDLYRKNRDGLEFPNRNVVVFNENDW